MGLSTMIGMVLSNRYRLLEKIGEGGMALVFKARDSLLGRIVAVKVLRPQFASDEEFVERFRREAMSAASLSHPNVVNIYDVGQDDETYFIVMEYVDGVNLKDVIKDRSPMPATEVIAMGRQILEAIEHAHRHDIVHRDVKPHNILITSEGRVKVTDFGIARAASRSSLTQTGMVMGSVHYFSPEQARGTATGIQSDLYSVGVVLYEMTTGTVPFKGDTPISVALAHIQDEAPSVRFLNPAAPPALERVIVKALSKELDKRYDSAASMLRDLYVAGSQAHDMVAGGIDATKVMRNAAKGQRAPVGDEPTLIRARDATGPRDGATPRRRRWVIPALVGSAVLVLLTLVAAFGPRLLFGKAEVEVPEFRGVRFDVAAAEAVELGVVLVRDGDGAWNAKVPEDHILSQQPPAGRVVKQGHHIIVVVSRGPERVEVPDVFGRPLKDAQNALVRAELEVGSTVDVFSPEVPLGSVLSQSPTAGTEVNKGSSVDMEISRGPEPLKLTLQNFIGLPLTEVEQILTQLGLTQGKVVPEPSETVESGIVVDQSPEAGTLVEPRQVVNLVVSQGSEVVPPGQDNPGSLRKYEVRVPVPAGPSSQEVRIAVTDELGTRTVYRRAHKPGDTVVQVVEAHGAGTIKVYIGGQLVKEYPT